jgi:hypothetical protein
MCFCLDNFGQKQSSGEKLKKDTGIQKQRKKLQKLNKCDLESTFNASEALKMHVSKLVCVSLFIFISSILNSFSQLQH